MRRPLRTSFILLLAAGGEAALAAGGLLADDRSGGAGGPARAARDKPRGASDSPGAVEAVKGSQLAAERDAECVRVLAGERLVARYRYGGVIRKPYLAELTAPGTPNVLLDAPPDHLHHHGVMFACKAGDSDFWAEGEKDGREVHVSFEPLRIDAAGGTEVAVLREKLRWLDSGGGALLDEERTLRILSPAAALAQVVIWESRLAPAGSKAVTLSGSPYHGLGMRFVRSMDRTGAFFSSAGLSGVEGTNGKTASWCAYTAEIAPGSPVTAAILDAPTNARHPARWFTMVEPFAYLCDTHAIGERPVVLAAGQSFVLKAAVVLAAGKADGARIERFLGEVSRDAGWKGPEPQGGSR